MSDETNRDGEGFEVQDSLADASPVDFLKSVTGFAHAVITDDDAWAASYKRLTDSNPLPEGVTEQDLRQSLHAQIDILGALAATAPPPEVIRAQALRALSGGQGEPSRPTLADDGYRPGQYL